jgi:hypothetical protein
MCTTNVGLISGAFLKFSFLSSLVMFGFWRFFKRVKCKTIATTEGKRKKQSIPLPGIEPGSCRRSQPGKDMKATNANHYTITE